MSTEDPIMERLQDQIDWYDRKSSKSQKSYKLFKLCTICAAAFIPLLAALKGIITVVPEIAAALGALIVILEGVQQLNRYQENWISYRSTCEALKHEKFLYLGKAGPYAAAGDAHALLTERIESLISQEHAKWVANQEQPSKAASTQPAADKP